MSNDVEVIEISGDMIRLGQFLKLSGLIDTGADAKAVIGITTSGYTAVRLSHHRPKASIYVFSPDARLRNVLGLYWGVQVIPFSSQTELTADQTVEDIKQTLVARGDLVSGDIFVNTLSMPLSKQRKTNTVKLSVVE